MFTHIMRNYEYVKCINQPIWMIQNKYVFSLMTFSVITCYLIINLMY